MFISNFEKETINKRLRDLETRVEQLARSLNALHDAQSLAADPTKLKLIEPKKKISHQARAKRNAYARKYYQRKKSEKLAQLASTKE